MIKEYRKQMRFALTGLGWGEESEWLKYAAIASGVFFLVSVLLTTGIWVLIFGTLSFLPLIGSYVLPVYFWASRQRKIDEELPQALYRAASNPFIPLEDLVEDLANGNTPLTQEFSKVARQVKNEIPVDQALEGLAKSNNSKLLKRAVSLLLQGYRTGADMSQALRETAEEISGIAEVMREQAASTTIEKYTLLLAGGVIVPIVLGSLISLVGSLDFAGLSELGFVSTKGLFENALLGSQIYIAEYAVLASIFVAYQENSPEKAVVYITVLVPLSMALFLLAKTAILV